MLCYLSTSCVTLIYDALVLEESWKRGRVDNRLAQRGRNFGLSSVVIAWNHLDEHSLDALSQCFLRQRTAPRRGRRRAVRLGGTGVWPGRRRRRRGGRHRWSGPRGGRTTPSSDNGATSHGFAVPRRRPVLGVDQRAWSTGDDDRIPEVGSAHVARGTRWRIAVKRLTIGLVVAVLVQATCVLLIRMMTMIIIIIMMMMMMMCGVTVPRNSSGTLRPAVWLTVGSQS